MTCDRGNNLLQNANDVKATACEEINKAGQCKESQINANTIRNKFQKLFDNTESPSMMESLRQNWDPKFAKFYLPRNKSDIVKKTPLIPLTAWLGDPKFSKSAKEQSQYKKSLVDKLVAYSQEFDCEPTFDMIATSVMHPKIKQFDSRKISREDKAAGLNNMRMQMANSKNIEALEIYFNKISDSALDPLNSSFVKICTTKPTVDGEGTPLGLVKQSEEYLPCAGNFRKDFEDNKYDISPNELKNLLAEKDTQELSTCIQKSLDKGAQIQQVTITSAASALNNRGEAEQRFCKKGFLALSQARAETAQNKILPGLFNQTGHPEINLSLVQVNLNTKGSNGDGTSGKCPYKYKDGQEILNPIFDTPKGKASLDENRYVRIQVTFKEKSLLAAEYYSTFQPYYPCREIKIKCE